jgi:hypothetical protein
MGVLCDMAMMVSIHNSRGGGRGEGVMGGSERARGGLSLVLNNNT